MGMGAVNQRDLGFIFFTELLTEFGDQFQTTRSATDDDNFRDCI